MKKLALILTTLMIVCWPIGNTLAQNSSYKLELLPTAQKYQDLPLLDIIIEPKTYTPYWYKGRSELTSGQPFKATAILPNNLSAHTYEWRLNSDLTTSNQASLTLTVPSLSQNISLEVTASDSAGRAVARNSVNMKVSQPEIRFYENNLLKGLSQISIDGQMILLGNETTIKAEPFFFSASPLNNSIRAKWTVGGSPATGEADWRYINLTKNANSGSDLVRLNVYNLNSLTEQATASFRLEVN